MTPPSGNDLMIDDAYRDATAMALADANINPRTGLATDYLNHFNEAILLLDMIPDLPDCAGEIMAWQPLSYVQHFDASHFAARDLAISAYQNSDPDRRAEFDALTGSMTAILVEVGQAMRAVDHDNSRAKLAGHAARWLRPLMLRAGGVINGVAAPSDDLPVDHGRDQVA